MRARCRDKNRWDAKYYAHKGVLICAQWDDVVAFREWALASGYVVGLTIDRRDGDKGYDPNNCRWVDRKVQARNLSKNRLLTLDSETRCVSEWAEITGISGSLIIARIDRLGWSAIAALTVRVGEIKTGPKRRTP